MFSCNNHEANSKKGKIDRELRLVWLYCVIDDATKRIIGRSRLRSRGPMPALTDVEALTIEIYGETLGLKSDASIWRYACDHLRSWFPGLGTEWNFVRRCANLSGLKERIQESLFAPSEEWNVFDGLPLPVCKHTRWRRDKRFRGEAAVSVCAAKNERYYGFKAGMLMNASGEFFRWWLGPANGSERDMLDSGVSSMTGLLLADKGLVSTDLAERLAMRGVVLTTPKLGQTQDVRSDWWIRQAMRLRRGIETAFGRLVEDFGVLRNRGRDFWRWSARFLRKVLAYNLLLRFERSVAAGGR